MTEKSPTEPLFRAGRSCGECLILASRLEAGPKFDALLSASRGLAAGRGEVCNVLLTGMMALGDLPPDEDQDDERPVNDFLDTYRSTGAPGASEAQNLDAPTKFKSRFEERLLREFGGITCADISGIDWSRRDAMAAPGGFPSETCQALTDAALEDLNELLP